MAEPSRCRTIVSVLHFEYMDFILPRDWFLNIGFSKSFQKRKILRGNNSEKRNLVNMGSYKVFNTEHTFSTKGEIDFTDLTDVVQNAVSKSGIDSGLVHVFAPHATGVLVLTENEYGLLSDIRTFLEKMIPKRQNYRHPSNAHSHLRSMLLPPDKTLPVISGRVEFGTWQSLIFVETDVYPRKRRICCTVMGTTE